MKTEKIDHRLLQIFAGVKGEGLLPLEAANPYPASRIRDIHKLRRFYVPDWAVNRRIPFITFLHSSGKPVVLRQNR